MRPLPLLALAVLGCRQPMESPIAVAPDAVWSEYDALLAEVVTEDGTVDYDALEANREPLDAMVRWFDGRRLHGSSKERGAMWLNAYNAFVLFAILEEGRPDSVNDVEGRMPFEGSGFFRERSFAVDANHYTLREIENERIRLRRLDYRVHAALNRGARSSPALRAEIYTGDRLDLQLNSQIRRWVNDPVRGIQVTDDGLRFSEKFAWYTDDFERWSGGQSVCLVAASYAERDLRARLLDAERSGCEVETFMFDWSLNDASSADADGIDHGDDQ